MGLTDLKIGSSAVGTADAEDGPQGPSSAPFRFMGWNPFTNLRARLASESGFTLVELLAVMLILGLLAGIGIPSFLSQREKAIDVEAKQAAGVAGRAAETLAIANDGRYDGPGGVTVASLRKIEATLQEADLTVLSAGANSYSIRVTAGTGNTFDYSRTGGVLTTACAPLGQGGCPEDGTWD